jgi:hypothetical protein
MNFKKFRGQIFGVEFHPKEQQAIDAEINRQMLERHKEFSDDVDYVIMKILHDQFGFGLTRLIRFYELFTEENAELVEHYEMPDAGTYIARKEMNAIGCNIEKWNQERSE